MTGFMFIGGQAIPSTYVTDGNMFRIRYTGCPDCLGEGIIYDHHGEPLRWCGCSVGEAVRQYGNAGGAS